MIIFQQFNMLLWWKLHSTQDERSNFQIKTSLKHQSFQYLKCNFFFHLITEHIWSCCFGYDSISVKNILLLDIYPWKIKRISISFLGNIKTFLFSFIFFSYQYCNALPWSYLHAWREWAICNAVYCLHLDLREKTPLFIFHSGMENTVTIYWAPATQWKTSIDGTLF